ncbi:hypothetical protein HK097_009415 [Rhizophlyctis rosea]|uniref:Uncharacterized protein n=1 Tax=Rhizophlyctis rosea TaxID=64517 RepID=A0AAD5SJC0_9FUNG|nr:hypothetical protein HK097_009415 [Rhizophlyctis rosea]
MSMYSFLPTSSSLQAWNDCTILFNPSIGSTDMVKTEREKRQDRGTSKLGTYLLQGWVMLEDSCETPGCNLPLMRTKDRSRTICVLCNDPNGADLPPQQPEPATAFDSGEETASEPEVLGTDAEAVGDVESVELERRREQGQLATRLLGQRMLAGWALLGENCRNSTCYGIPLVRNRQKRKHCVICQTWYDDEVENNAERDKAAEPVNGPSSASGKEKQIADDTTPSDPERTPKAMEPFASHASDLTKKRKIDTPSTTPAFVPVTSDRQSIASYATTSVGSEVDQTIGALLQRLTSLRHALEQPSLHPAEIKVISDAISSVAAAITACQAVRKT